MGVRTDRRNPRIKLIAAAVIGGLILLGMAVMFSPNHIDAQTESVRITSFDNAFQILGEALITVKAPDRMYVGEGFQNVDVNVELLEQGNVTGYRLVKLVCLLGTLNNYRFIPFNSDFYIFGNVGDTYQSTMNLDPKQGLNEARIQIEMSMEVFFDDGHSEWSSFSTGPVFGLYEVQNRLMPIIVLICANVVGGMVVLFVLTQNRTSQTRIKENR